MQALKLLDLIRGDGQLTEEFANLRRVPTPEYGPKLAEMLRDTYAEVFSFVDPSSATYEQVRDAFRGFTPSGQIDRMVALFLALLEHAGQFEDLPKARLLKLQTPQGAMVRVAARRRRRERRCGHGRPNRRLRLLSSSSSALPAQSDEYSRRSTSDMVSGP